MAKPIYALILAGGSGERFWPLSRRARPKQLLRLVSKETLLEETVARLDGLVPRERILILTNTEQEAAVRKLLADFPGENVLAEPAKRDTAAAVALGTGWVAARDHAATMLVLPADHVIANRAAFQETLALAAEAAEETGELVAIGIKPTWACPGFGYIEHGEPVRLRNRPDNGSIHRVLRFRQKADRVLVVEASFDWDDIGSWRAVANYFKNDDQGNAANCAITAVDSTNNIVFDQNGTTMALLGVHNLIVVRTGDAVLVCDRQQAERIKNLIGKLPPDLQ